MGEANISSFDVGSLSVSDGSGTYTFTISASQLAASQGLFFDGGGSVDWRPVYWAF